MVCDSRKGTLNKDCSYGMRFKEKMTGCHNCKKGPTTLLTRHPEHTEWKRAELKYKALRNRHLRQ